MDTHDEQPDGTSPGGPGSPHPSGAPGSPPSSQPNAATPSDWWFDVPAPDPSAPDRAVSKRSIGTWIATGAGVVALAIGAIVGVNVASSKLSTAQASAGQGVPGGMGFPGGVPGQGGPGAVGFPGGVPGQGGGVGGTIASIDGTTLTLTTRSGSTTKVDASGATVTRSTEGSVGDVRVGDNVTVLGAGADGGSGSSVTARTIVDSRDVADAGPGGMAGGLPAGGQNGQVPQPPTGQNGQATGQNGQLPQPPTGQNGQGTGQDGQLPGAPAGMAPTRGTVSAIDGTTLTVTTTDGSTVTVETDDTTRVVLEETSSLSSLQAGEQVQVRGSSGADGTVTATSIRVGDGAGPNGAGGPAMGPPGMNQNGNAGAGGGFPGSNQSGNAARNQNGNAGLPGSNQNGNAQQGAMASSGVAGPMTRSGAS
ncbi:MAG: DUF5666 domain-containing protein [Acidimicrobiales bacterium]